MSKLFTFELPLIAALGCLLTTQPRERWTTWLSRGQIGIPSLLFAAITAVLCIPALLAWANWTDNLGAGYEHAKQLALHPGWLVFGVVIPLFAVLNAFVEEAVYRGVVQDALGWAFHSPASAITLQASLFAAAHVAAGFPNGLVGYTLCFIFAVPLGWLRWRTGGILLPVLVHVVADLTVGFFLCMKARE